MTTIYEHNLCSAAEVLFCQPPDPEEARQYLMEYERLRARHEEGRIVCGIIDSDAFAQELWEALGRRRLRGEGVEDIISGD